MTTVDAQYYEVAKPHSTAERLVIAARKRMFRDFMVRMDPRMHDSIIDVGVSDVITDGANILEQSYPFPSAITACGIGHGEGFRAAFPEVEYRQIEPNVGLPFARHSFEIATANAVLEHVGSDDFQKMFVRELSRVAKRVFITVPNRHFPIEHHTAIPFLHYADRSFGWACSALDKTDWAKSENLILMTRRRLWKLAEGINKSVAVGYTGLRMGPFSSNLFLAIH